MKKIPLYCIIFFLLAGFLLSGVPVRADETTEATEGTVAETTEPGPVIAPQGQLSQITSGDASVSNGCHTMAAKIPLGGSEQILKTARSAILYEVNSGTLLYALNPDEKIYPASLVKAMTGLLLSEYGNLDQTVTVSQSAVDSVPYDAVSIELQAGETVTLRDLYHAMMVESANDACAVIAEALAGTQAAFVERMNQRAEELGCTGTHFVNAHGIHHEEQYSTARDIGIIMTEALKHESFREAYGAITYTIPANGIAGERNLVTANYFMSREHGVVKFYDTRVIGGRTGAIGTTNRHMICSAVSGNMELLSIVMGTEAVLEADGYSLYYMGNFEETAELLNWGFRNFTMAQILHEGKSVAQFPVSGGANHVVGRPVETVFSALPYGATEEHLTWHYPQMKELSAPVAEGDAIGKVQVWYGGICLAQSDMVSMSRSAVKEQASGSDIVPDTPDSNGLGWFLAILGVIFAVFIALVLILIILRLIRRWIIRNRRRRRIKNRRRSRG